MNKRKALTQAHITVLWVWNVKRETVTPKSRIAFKTGRATSLSSKLGLHRVSLFTNNISMSYTICCVSERLSWKTNEKIQPNQNRGSVLTKQNGNRIVSVNIHVAGRGTEHLDNLSWYMHKTQSQVTHAYMPSSQYINVAGSTIPFFNHIKLVRAVTLDSNLKFDQIHHCSLHVLFSPYLRFRLMTLTKFYSLWLHQAQHRTCTTYINKSITKVVIGSCHTDHSISRLQIWHGLPIEYRIAYNTSSHLLTFNADTATSSQYLSSLINSNYQQSDSLRSLNCQLIITNMSSPPVAFA